MTYQTLPLPNPGDWTSVAGAAKALGVSRRTVERMIIDGRLVGYALEGSPDRVASRILWKPDVENLAQALRLTAGPRRGRRTAGVHG